MTTTTEQPIALQATKTSTDVAALAADIAKVLELDANLQAFASTPLCQHVHHQFRKKYNLHPDNTDIVDIANSHALAKDIIRRQQELLREAAEALRLADVVCFNRHADTTGAIRSVLARITPLLKGSSDDK